MNDINLSDLDSPNRLVSQLRGALSVPLDGWQELQSGFAPVDVRTGERLRRIPQNLKTARRAAVLVPLILDDSRPRLVYTVRKGHLNDHAGQISFPGGSRDPQDTSLTETALREAEEEIDLQRNAVEVIGSLEDMYIPPSNFLVRPFVGVLDPGAKFTLAPEEVEEIFTAELQTLLTPETFNRRLWTRDGRDLDVPVFSVTANEKTHDIWGATAAITASLLARLGWNHPEL